jgi:hypothetical protein
VTKWRGHLGSCASGTVCTGQGEESAVLGGDISVAGGSYGSGVRWREQDRGRSVAYTWQECICLETRQGEASSVVSLSGSIHKAPGKGKP